VQDAFCHQVGFEGVDPTSPHHEPERAGTDWSILRRQYELCDEWIGRVVRECADERTVVAVISDHGAIPIRKSIPINQILVDEGLLSTELDEETGRATIAWSRTKAYNRPGFPACYIWVNVRGRDPEGIVAPGEEYEAVCAQVITALYSVRDPETGLCPIALALKKEDAALLGHGGDRAADIVYFFQPGYSRGGFSAVPAGVTLGDQEREMLIGESAGHGTHSGYLPTAEMGPFTNKAMLVLAGPGVRKGYDRARPIRLIDVAPTLCQLLGIPSPAQSEGAVVQDLLVK
jgi:predicted AlkP superfamily phosphohydrolase/phosphomutase